MLRHSAEQVAEVVADELERVLPVDGPDPWRPAESDPMDVLIALGRIVVRQRVEHAEHFAMVRQITLERAHFPPSVFRAWQEAGPLRVRREMARRLARLSDLGLLRVVDPERAARHLVSLTRDEDPDAAADGDLAEAIRVFVHGYGA